jgi:hypothetical protein
VLLSTQATNQGALTQLRAAERDRRMAFIVDMACQGTSAILYEVIPFFCTRDCELPKFLYVIRHFKFPNHIPTLLKLPLTLHFAHIEYSLCEFHMILT